MGPYEKPVIPTKAAIWTVDFTRLRHLLERRTKVYAPFVKRHYGAKVGVV